ncbi:reticulon-4-interacting protein 1 homolog, mitochondrial-like [Venturia canescens]|uniref:reticulon-4-interacting protein 1 homolog, mitochondrial-like n=1 Tax=Venturia canescens TaxID=32260 RepID=UPI001C9BF7D7|nr:reticulon-4-interacting protein 1 homolog, mitochondrial-like [Venturia canescens]
MDEIWFRLTNQLEVLQVEGSVVLQQGQQWISTFLEKIHQFLKSACSEEYTRQIADLARHLMYWVQRFWEQVQFQYYSVQFNSRALYHHMGNLCFSNVSRREVAFCIAGLGIGTLLGYNIGLHWRHKPSRVQYMRAVMCHHYIGIEGVSMVDDAEVPTIQRPNELLIQVKAASLNVVDAKISTGYSRVYRKLLNSGSQKELPVVLGRDCSGIVAEIGQSVLNFDVGDEVFLAMPSWASGTMAEYIVVAESQVAKRPKHINFEACASLPYSGCLAWDAIVNRSVIGEGNAKGKRILVYGGCSSVGCILIQLAKLWGAHVTTICKLELSRVVKALGADDVISLEESNIEKELSLYDKYHAIFYTGGYLSSDLILKRHLLPHGSFVSTMPEYLTSDSLGFVLGSIFSGCVRIRLLLQYMFGRNGYQWIEGSRINSNYLEILRELVDADQLQSLVGAAFRPNHIEQALHHVLSTDVIGGTIIKFQ